MVIILMYSLSNQLTPLHNIIYISTEVNNMQLLSYTQYSLSENLESTLFKETSIAIERGETTISS